MIKMVVSDIDGTLLTEGTDRMNPEMYEVIRELKKKGILFVAASGRQYASMMYVLEPVADDIIFVTENGMNIIRQGETLMSDFIDQKLAEEVVQYCRGLTDAEAVLCTPKTQYLERKNERFIDWLENGYHSQVKLVDDLMPYISQANKISVYREKGAADIGDQFQEKFGSRLNVLVSGGPWIDVMNIGSDKSSAVAHLQKMLNITVEETMAFGDNCNDIGMLGRASESYAVANAHPHLIEAARYVAPPPEENGVLNVLKEKFLKET